MNSPYTESRNSFNELANDNEFQINFFDIARLIWGKRILLVCTVIVVMIITAIVVSLKPDIYKSTASILPSGRTYDLSSIRKVIGLAGYTSSSDENSSLLYPIILQSNQVRDAVLREQYVFVHESEEIKLNFQEYFGADQPDILRKALGDITNISMDKKIGVIEISVATKYPQLSRAILKKTLDELENFNIYKQRSSAKENVRYLEREIAEKEKELRASEDTLEAYQKANRNWHNTNDPGLLKMLARLKRDVEVRLSTYIFLRERYEGAKLDEQNDVPIVRILDEPTLPTLKSGPLRARTVILSGIVASFLVIILMIVVDTVRKYGIYVEKDLTVPSIGGEAGALKERVRV